MYFVSVKVYFCCVLLTVKLMFTTGRIVFTLLFLLLFIVAMLFAYRKDAGISKLHFPKSYRLLVIIMLIFSVLFLIIKVKTWFFK